MKAQILTPPILQGSEQQQLAALRDYLVYVSQQFDTALVQLDGSVNEVASVVGLRPGSGGTVPAATQAGISQQAATLRQLIVNNAKIVKSEIDTLSATLKSDYVAESDYGTFTKNVETVLYGDPESMEMKIGITQQIKTMTGTEKDLSKSVANVSEGLSNYISRTQGYIRFGIVAYDGMDPQLGIAIGQNLTKSGTGTVGDKEYDIVAQENFRSVFTTQKLSFYQGDKEVAYLSNNKLFITDAEITGTLKMGNWQITQKRGFSIKWIGG